MRLLHRFFGLSLYPNNASDIVPIGSDLQGTHFEFIYTSIRMKTVLGVNRPAQHLVIIFPNHNTV